MIRKLGKLIGGFFEGKRQKQHSHQGTGGTSRTSGSGGGLMGSLKRMLR